MSSRALRRLLKTDELSTPDDEESGICPPRVNVFESLTREESSDEVADVVAEPKTESQQKAPRKIKKKKTLKASKDKVISKEDDKDLDEAISKLESAAVQDDEPSETSRSAHEFMNIDANAMDAVAELRRKIGGRDVEEDALGLPENLPRRVAAQIKSRMVRRRPLRKNQQQLVHPKPHWPVITTGLIGFSVVVNGEKGDFCLVPNQSYQEQFDNLCLLLETGDIDAVITFLAKNPLHVDAMLIVSDFVRMSSAADAADLIERALHVLEKSFLSCDSLDVFAKPSVFYYSIFDNRRLHLALIRHVQYLTRKGCYRTALEFVKLMYKLDPLDPLGALLMVDFLAIQLELFEWFDQLYEMLRGSPLLVNLHFSHALSIFMRGDAAKATAELTCLLVKHAYMAIPLCQAAGLRIDEFLWKERYGKLYEIEKTNVACITQAVAKLYAARTGPLWKTNAVSAWLSAAVVQVLANNCPQAPLCGLESLSVGCTLPIYRHAILTDLANLNIAMPPTISSEAIHIYDPIPPEDDYYEGPSQGSKLMRILSSFFQ